MEHFVEKTGDRWRLPLDGMRVAGVSDRDYLILERGDDRAELSLAPCESGQRLIGRVVVDASVYRGGKIELNFDDGQVLAIEAERGVEGWELIGPGKVFVVAPTTEYGEPAIWDDRSPTYRFDSDRGWYRYE
jgi:hypothetical protein